ncbi:MAG: tetratricopeptide repeat protein [Planctomycetota bacterium]
MATRVNTRFVLILVVTLLAAVGIVGGLWFLQMRGDTTRNIRAGDERMAEGEQALAGGDVVASQGFFEKALRQYGRAAHKEPEALSHLDKIETALQRIRPTAQSRANELYGLHLEVLRRKARYQRRDPEAHLNFLTELHGLARQFKEAGVWQDLADAADDMDRNVPESEPLRDRALLYRGMARMRVMGLAGMGPISARAVTDREITEAEENLLDFVRVFPQDDLGWATLAESQLSVARWRRVHGISAEADEDFEKADETLSRALESVPDGPEVARVAAFRLTLRRIEDRDASVDEELQGAVDRLEQLVAASDDPLLLVEATDIIRTADSAEGLPRSVHLMRAYVNAHPDELYQRLQYAQLCYAAREHDPAYLDDAYAAARMIIEAEPVPVSLLSRVQQTLRISAAGLIVDVEHRRWMRADAADRGAKLQDMEAARARLLELVAEPDNNVTLIRADGKIAAARGDFAVAAAKFERALKLAAAADFDTLWHAARALEEEEQWGLACERLVQADRLRPGNPVVLAEKARLEYRIGRFGAARLSAQTALQIDPDNQQAQRLLMAIQAAEPDARSRMPVDPAARAVLDARAAAVDDRLDEARDILLAALEEATDRLSLLSELITVEIRAGRTEEALRLTDEALELQPNNQFLRRIKFSLGTEDPIEALKLYLSEVHEDEADRAVHTRIQLWQLARRMDGIAERQAASGDDEAAEETRAQAAAARGEAEQFLARATELAPNHPELLDHLFNEAVLAEDEPALADVVERARAVDADQAGGLIFRGRLELYRGDYQRAVQTLTEATNRKDYSSLAWRLLGRAHERVGNFPEALGAYEAAYTCNPNDLRALRWYATLLIQTGDETRALRLLRAAQRTALEDEELRELRLQLEATTGNLALAIRERHRMYERSPGDRRNAVRLLALLARSQPSYEHLLDAQGEPMFDAGRWAVLSDGERREALDQVSAQWQARSAEIIGALETAQGDTLEVAALRAEILKARGEVDAGEEVLRAFCDRHGDASSAEPLIALGRYQAGVNRLEAATATYTAARAYQSEDLREADRALADLLFGANQWAQAAEFYGELSEVVNDRNVRLRLAECYLKLQQYEEASAAVEQAVADGGQDFFTAMLSAGIAGGQGDQLSEQARLEEARHKYAEADTALDEAQRLRPSSPLPHVRRAQRLIDEHRRSGRITLLDDAMVHLNRAEEVAASAEMISRVRVEIYRLKGDLRGAVGELTRLLERTPDNVAARRLLVQLYVDSGDEERAVGLIDEAIIRNPTIAPWHELKGDLLVRMDRVPDAIVEFRQAHDLQPSSVRLAKYAETALGGDAPAYADVAELASSAPELVEGRPLVRTLYARALSGIGRYEDAVQQMQAAYREHRQLLDEGRVDRAGLVNWLRALQAVMGDRGPVEYERFVTELADGRPDAVEQWWIARAWAGGGPEGPSRAIELVQLALAECSADDTALRAQLQFDLGQFEVVAGNLPAAVEAFERVIEVEPDNVQSLNNAAYIYAEHLGDPARALPYAERAVALMPNEASVLDTLGWIYYGVGRHEEAEEYLRRAAKSTPTADNHFHLATVLFERVRSLEPERAARQLGTARTYLQRAAELGPSAELQMKIDRLAEEIDAWARRSGQRPRR